MKEEIAKKKLTEIGSFEDVVKVSKYCIYGDTRMIYFCKADVQYAIDHNQFCTTHYQDPNIGQEIGKICSKENLSAFDAARLYHIRRIAYLVKHRQSDPIRLRSDGTIKDGAHRILAAIFREDEEIDCYAQPLDD